MPRGDGTGPLGNGPIGRRRGNCQNMNLNRQADLWNTQSANQNLLEHRASQLEEQAANLRRLAKQNSTNK